MSEYEPVSQLRQRRRGVEGYCLGTDESVLSVTDGEPPIYEEGDGVFCDDRLSEGT